MRQGVNRVAIALTVLLASVAGACSEKGRQEVLTTTEPELGQIVPPQADHAKRAPRDTRDAQAGRVAAFAVRPAIRQWPISFTKARLVETAAYAMRHYGRATYRLRPRVIVEHYTVTSTARATFNTFASDRPDVELHELPGLCSHFVVDHDGTIYQLAPLKVICRHTVGLNDVAIGIEHVGSSDAEILDNAAQLRASLMLTGWLRCRYGIALSNVIGHNESLDSPYHHERVAALKRQTHGDFGTASMDGYRARLPRRRCD